MARYTSDFVKNAEIPKQAGPRIIELRPVREEMKDYDAVAERIREVFKKVLYWPLLKVLPIPSLKLSNASDALLRAIQEGVVTYANGVFQGSFNSQISKELKELGASWNIKTATYRLSADNIPENIKWAIGASQRRFVEKLQELDARIQKILPEEIAELVKVEDIFDSQLWKVDKAVKKTLENITVTPTLTPEQRLAIAADWQENMRLWITDFTREEIRRLRFEISESVYKGNRYESIVKSIQESYGVTSNKAKFLARQETNLLMSKFKETRYEAAGVKEYRWRCVAGSKNHPVRPSHKALDGKIFRFDNPPITTAPSEPARRNNPGEDYNCRCYAIPVVRKEY